MELTAIYMRLVLVFPQVEDRQCQYLYTLFKINLVSDYFVALMNNTSLLVEDEQLIGMMMSSFAVTLLNEFLVLFQGCSPWT